MLLTHAPIKWHMLIYCNWSQNYLPHSPALGVYLYWINGHPPVLCVMLCLKESQVAYDSVHYDLMNDGILCTICLRDIIMYQVIAIFASVA